MSSIYISINAFNAGELSPKMLGRNDVSQYHKGCATLLNFLVTPYGSVERRPGTLDFGAAAGNTVRLIRFVFSSTVAYICEFTENGIRFFKPNDKTPVDTITDGYPYSAEDLADIRFVQSADVMTLVHPDHPVYELRRLSENEFELRKKQWEYPPMLDPNLDDDITISASGTEAGSSITLTASSAIFDPGDVGGHYELVHIRQENELKLDITGNTTSDSIEVKGYWTFTTHGTWTGVVKIQRSTDNGNTWSDFRTYSSSADSNVSTSGEEEEDGAFYRVEMSGYTASTTGTLKLCRVLLANPDFSVTGVVEISGTGSTVSGSTTATGTVIRALGSTAATAEWSEGAFSGRRGYPKSVAYYEERMFFGGTKTKPQTIWGSKTGDWDNYLLGSKDDDGIEFTLASDTVNEISWMVQHDALVIGTADSEWTLSSSSSDTALTATNFKVKRQSVYGSNGIPAVMAGESVLFVQRGSRKVREFVYSWEKDGYSCPDMTILADHITAGGIKEIALMQQPDTILWCLLGNGTLAALTYERDQEVVGWHRHKLGEGEIVSIAVIPNGSEDILFLAAKLGDTIRLLKMQPRLSGFYVDYGTEIVGSTATPVTGFTAGYLDEREVQIVVDGSMQSPQVVTGGTVTLVDGGTESVIFGLGYTSEMTTMPIELDTQNGQSLLRKKTIGEIRVRYYNSIGGEAKSGDSEWQMILSRDVLLDTLDAAITVKSDVAVLNPASGYSTMADISIRQRDPLPFNLTAIVATYSVVE